MAKPPLTFTFYIAAPIEKVWNGFVSKETNQTIFMGADFEVDLKPGGTMTWSGPGKSDSKSIPKRRTRSRRAARRTPTIVANGEKVTNAGERSLASRSDSLASWLADSSRIAA